MTPLQSGPWECISVDFAEVSGQYVLIIVDDYSRFPVAELIHSTSAKAVIPRLDRLFSIFDRPDVLKSDNGPPFNSSDFRRFSKELGFIHRKVTPLWPEANGEAERFVRTFKKLLLTSGQNWKKDMHSFFRSYRMTSHCTTGIPPATAFFNRSFKGKFPEVMWKSSTSQSLVARDTVQKAKMKKYADNRRNTKQSQMALGDCVLVKQPKVNKFSTPFCPKPYRVTKTTQ